MRTSSEGGASDHGEAVEREVAIPVEAATLTGSWSVPSDARGAVLFAHGSGSSRFSPRNRFVAEVLRAGGLATLLLDLFTPAEEEVDEETAHLRFDIGFLAKRLLGAARWLRQDADASRLPCGYFGASTGAAAALVAAAEGPDLVQAIVSRGGRPDLAGPALASIRAPTLLIVGGRDDLVIELNRRALAELACEKRIEIVPGATHLFEEPGALDRVAKLARDWFRHHLAQDRMGPRHHTGAT
ncbi:dienelactone hydrolase family protein [Sorangium sp. So ce363]|uniref:dienelactone hydrolase family protein n=1 Tax=Sorangium sp. So ce363 TaxID=3133304 RepID=UPI003F60BD49